MAKITRKKLARGAKLVTEHVFTPASAAQTQMTTANIEAEQLSSRYAPFRVNLSLPRLSGATNRVAGPTGGRCFHGIPFVLPPLQEDMVYTTDPRTGARIPTISDSAPEIILDEVSFSFDQRMEPAAIVSNWSTGSTGAPWTAAAPNNSAKVSYDMQSRLKIDLMIFEKQLKWLEGTSLGFEPNRMVWSGTINPIDTGAGFFRLNPWVSSGINQVIDPYKSYTFVISAPELFSPDTSEGAELVSVEVSMRFLARLTSRDKGNTIQNIPNRHLGEQNKNLTHTAAGTTGAGINSSTSRALIGATPAAGDAVVANDAGASTLGTQTVLAVIDEFSRRKLHGGYKMDADVPMLEEIKDSAAYTVLSVPLFNNGRWGGKVCSDWTEEPYVVSGTDSIIDRRYIPIESPMTIHHVIFSYSWMPFLWWDPSGGGSRETADTLPSLLASGLPPGTFRCEIGVGIGTGMRGDHYGYTQVAFKSISNPVGATWQGGAIDRIQLGQQSTASKVGTGVGTTTTYPANVELHAADLVGGSGVGFNGAQGKPVFVGRGTSATASRTVVDGGAPATAGQEQWIEVRGRIGDSAGTNIATGYTAESMILGAGGIWVYIIGKTHLV